VGALLAREIDKPTDGWIDSKIDLCRSRDALISQKTLTRLCISSYRILHMHTYLLHTVLILSVPEGSSMSQKLLYAACKVGTICMHFMYINYLACINLMYRLCAVNPAGLSASSEHFTGRDSRSGDPYLEIGEDMHSYCYTCYIHICIYTCIYIIWILVIVLHFIYTFQLHAARCSASQRSQRPGRD
jgi:hypothetical protein